MKTVFVATAIVASLVSINANSASTFLSGGNYSTSVISNKTLMMSGDNRYGYIKPGSGVSFYTTFTKMMSDISKVSSGDGRTAFISDCGDLYYIGWKTGSESVGSTYIGQLPSLKLRAC